LYVLFSLGLFGFLLTVIITPLVRDFALRLGIVDHPDESRKLHPTPVPRVGGIAVFISYLLAFGATAFGFLKLDLMIPTGPLSMGLLVAISVVFLTGLLDDIFQLRPWQKLAGQVFAAVLAYQAGVQIHLFRGLPLQWLSLPCTVLWLIGCTNAFNLIDGLDGLATGVGLFATVTTLIAALTQQNLELAVATIPLVGCLIGFLRYNFNPASVFLGDCGSLSIGFFLGCCGALWGQKSATLLGMVAPVMALSIPLLDVGLSILRRFLRRQPIFGADRRHIHHLLLDRGLTPSRVVMLLYGFCAVAAIFSLLQNSNSNAFGGLVVVLFCVAAWIGIQHLDYAEFGLATRLIFKGAFRQIIDVQVRLQQFERSLASAATLEQRWQCIRTGCREFGFTGVRLKVHDRTLEFMPQLLHGAHWQLRIPLPDSQYVNLYRDFESDLEPTVLAGFARILESSLKNNPPLVETEVLTMGDAVRNSRPESEAFATQ
jgi:UDP-GlcNAc:undecaprenyl-phosphate GlcNAc-1-phosphate transferase